MKKGQRRTATFGSARMMDVRFCFHTRPDDDGRYHQFFVRVCRRGQQLVTLLDLAADEGGVIEGVSVEFVEALQTAIEMVKGRVKADELHEQTE